MMINNGWLKQMETGETQQITLKEIGTTKNGKPYILANDGEQDFRANIGLNDKNKETGKQYTLKCTGHKEDTGFPYITLMELSERWQKPVMKSEPVQEMVTLDSLLYDYELIIQFKSKLNTRDAVVMSIIQKLEHQLLASIGEVTVNQKREAREL